MQGLRGWVRVREPPPTGLARTLPLAALCPAFRWAGASSAEAWPVLWHIVLSQECGLGVAHASHSSASCWLTQLQSLRAAAGHGPPVLTTLLPALGRSPADSCPRSPAGPRAPPTHKTRFFPRGREPGTRKGLLRTLPGTCLYLLSTKLVSTTLG